jgi:hypothetical protein
MTLRCLIPALISAMAIGCAAQPPAPTVRNATLIGGDNAGMRVFIKRVDDGPILWAHPGALATRVTITPGQHRVSVMCEDGASGGFLLGDISLDVQSGRTYDLAGSAQSGAKNCEVSATMRGT